MAKDPCSRYLRRDRIVHGASARKDLRRPKNLRRRFFPVQFALALELWQVLLFVWAF